MPVSASSSMLSVRRPPNSEHKLANFPGLIAPSGTTKERERRERSIVWKQEMEYRSDKWRALSAPASKTAPNLLICSCQLCFCVPGDPDQLTGRGSTFHLLSIQTYWHEGAWMAAACCCHASVAFIPPLLLCLCCLFCFIYKLI